VLRDPEGTPALLPSAMNLAAPTPLELSRDSVRPRRSILQRS
jgi:hypothetical protein